MKHAPSLLSDLDTFGKSHFDTGYARYKMISCSNQAPCHSWSKFQLTPTPSSLAEEIASTPDTCCKLAAQSVAPLWRYDQFSCLFQGPCTVYQTAMSGKVRHCKDQTSKRGVQPVVKNTCTYTPTQQIEPRHFQQKDLLETQPPRRGLKIFWSFWLQH